VKVSLFAQAPYRALPADFEQRFESVVTTPWDLVDPDEIHASFRDFLDQMMAGARLGFDGLAMTEHGQCSYDMVPNPSLIASALAYATDAEGLEVAIYPVGRSLGKSKEPLRVAEEMAMIDAISGGRLVAGFPVGLAYDANINNGVPPIETRARFDENLSLVLRAWTEPEPFAFNGRYSQHAHVNIWPRPVQRPRPPVWITGVGNPATMQFTLEHDYGFNYFGWFGVKTTGRRIFDRFWGIADRLGQPRNPYRMGMMQVICVGNSDADAEREYAPHVEYFFRKGLGSIPMERLALPGGIEIPGLQAIMRNPGDFGIYAQMRTATFRDLADAGCVIIGGPDTVADQLVEMVRDFGIGHLCAMLQIGSMGRELTLKNITLFAEEVLPRLREIWTDEDWDNHWWPERLGGTPLATDTSARPLART
jgi:alkanesulfonate monooxygenase SsuD/methylene tetrahydromethanopterin reductase-like flavin-dependent oxidoreductase (luciferase family)